MEAIRKQSVFKKFLCVLLSIALTTSMTSITAWAADNAAANKSADAAAKSVEFDEGTVNDKAVDSDKVAKEEKAPVKEETKAVDDEKKPVKENESDESSDQADAKAKQVVKEEKLVANEPEEPEVLEVVSSTKESTAAVAMAASTLAEDSVSIAGWVYDGNAAGSSSHPLTVVRDGQTVVNPSTSGLSNTYRITYTSLTTNRTVSSPTEAGSYSVKVEYKSGLLFSYKTIGTATFTIERKEVTVTAGATKQYGASDPALVSVAGVIGSFNISYNASRESGENAGSYAINLSADEIQGNYKVVCVSGNFVITPAPATVAAGASKTYGDADPALAQVSGLVRGDSTSVISYTATREAGENVGSYAITVSGTTDQGNYKVSFVNGNLAINHKAITVTANASGKTYGASDPELTAAVSNMVAGESADELIKYTVSREAGENVGTYNINVSGDAVQGNYAITYKSGAKFSISQKKIQVIANNRTKVYKENDPELTATVVGAISSEDAAKIKYTLQRTSGENVGEYAISFRSNNLINNYNPTSQGNYTVEFVESDAKLTITPMAVKVVANPKTVIYGDPVGSFTAEFEPGRNDVARSLYNEISSTIDYGFECDTDGNAGTYTITPTGSELQGNFKVEYVSATLTIAKRTVTVTPNPKTMTYGSAVPELSATVSNTVNGEMVDYGLSRDYGEFSGSYENVGTYNIYASGEEVQNNGNYIVEYKTSTFTVKPAIATIVVDPATKVYGEDDPAFTSWVSGIVAGESADLISYTLSRMPGENVGSYAIVPVFEQEQGNYVVKDAANMLTITQRPITVHTNDVVLGQTEHSYYVTSEYEPAILDGDSIGTNITYSQGLYNSLDYGVHEGCVQVKVGKPNNNYAITYGNKGDLIVPGAPGLDNDRFQLDFLSDNFTSIYDGTTKLDDIASQAAKYEYKTLLPGSYGVRTPVITTTVLDGHNNRIESLDGEGIDAGTYTVRVVVQIDYEGALGIVERSACATKTVTLTILPRELTVKADDKQKDYDGNVYGVAEGEKYTYTLIDNTSWPMDLSGLDIDVTYEGDAIEATEVGEWTITPVVAEGYSPNFVIYTEGGTLAIKKVDAENAKLNASGFDVEYDGNLHYVSASVVNVDPDTEEETAATGWTVYYKVGEDEWTTTAPGAKNFTGGEIAVQVKATNPNHNDIYAETSMNVSKAPLVVSAKPADQDFYSTGLYTRTYDAKAVAFSNTIDGFKGTDTIDVVDGVVTYGITSGGNAVDEAKYVGSYSIMPNVDELSADNYELVTDGCTLVIQQATITVVCPDIQKDYDGMPYGDLTDKDIARAQVSGIMATDAANIDVTYSVDQRYFTKGEWANAVSASIANAEGVEGIVENYKLSCTKGTLTIAPVAFTVEDLSPVVYNGYEQKQTPVVMDGNNVLEEGTDYTVSYAGDTTNVTSAGVVVTIRGINNYIGETTKAYQILPAAVILSVGDYEKTYGQADPEFNIIAEGFIGEDTIDILPIQIVREEGEDVGEYNIYATRTDLEPQAVEYGDVEEPAVEDFVPDYFFGNYAVKNVDSKLVINKADIKVTTDSASKEYDGTPITASGTIEGLQFNDYVDFATVGAQTEVGQSTNTYTINWTGAKESNYNVIEDLGTLTITESQNEPVDEPDDPADEPEDPAVDPDDPEDPAVDPEDPADESDDPATDPEDPADEPDDPVVNPDDPADNPIPDVPDNPVAPVAPVAPAAAANPLAPVAVATGVADDLAVIDDNANPLAAPADEDAEEMTIDDEENPLANSPFDKLECWVHVWMIIGMVLTVLYTIGVVVRRLLANNDDDDNRAGVRSSAKHPTPRHSHNA